jgi:hypothetical protein
MSARYLETEVLPAPPEGLAPAGTHTRTGSHTPAGSNTDVFAPAPSSAGLLAGTMLLALFPIPFVFANGPAWAVHRLLPPLRTAGWVALAVNAAVLALCCLSKPLRAPIGVLTYRLGYLYGGIAWLSGLALTYLLWGVGAVLAGIVCLGGGVVTTGLLSTLIRGDWQQFLPLLVFVALAFAARGTGIKLARHGAKYRR